MPENIRNITKKDYWINSIPIIFITGGVISLLLGKFSMSDSDWKVFFNTVGTTILSGGVFSFILKYLQFSKIFKDDLLDIIYSEKYLKQQKNLIEIWERVSKIVFKNKFETISGQILEDVKKTYLPTDQVLYYNNVKQTLEIKLIDSVNQKIKVVQHSDFEIVVEDKNQELNLKSINSILHNNRSNEVKFEIKSLTVNNINYEITPNIPLNNRNEIKHEYDINLKGSTNYIIKIEIEKEYYILDDNIIGYQKKYIIRGLNLHIILDNKLKLRFNDCGTLNKFTEKKYKNNDTHYEFIYDGHIYPKQGYMIVLEKNNF